MGTLIQLRRGSTSQWATANPILHAGEPGFALDAHLLKIGDGTTHWADLVALGGSPDLSGYVLTSDARLSDARVPLAHVHAEADITNLVADLAARVLTSDARLSDARVPLAHTQAFSTITGLPTSLAGYGILDTLVLPSRTVNGHALSADVVVTKGDLGLGSVENTALSTWGGSALITQVGTLANLTVTAPIVGSVTGASGSTSGNAATATLAAAATVLATPRTINGVSFDGSGNITVAAAAATLTGTALAATVVTAALTAITPAAGSGLAVSLSTTGDLTVNTDQFVVDTSTARVGIGTTAPSQPLHVLSTANAEVLCEGLTAIFSAKNTQASGKQWEFYSGVISPYDNWGLYNRTDGTLPIFVNADAASYALILRGGKVAVGMNVVGSTPLVPPATLTVNDTSASDPRGIMSAQYSTDAIGARIHLRKARGTEAVSAIVVTGDVLGQLRVSGYDGATHLQVASIEVVSTGTIAATRVPTYMTFSVATDAAPSVLTEGLRVAATLVSTPLTVTITKDAVATQTTEGLTLQNTTAATAGIPVQQSPRLRFRANVWNTTTPATNTDDWLIESVPASAAAPSGLLKIGRSLNGGAVTFPLTIDSGGTISAAFNINAANNINATASVSAATVGASNYNIGASGVITWTSSTKVSVPANGQFNLTNNLVSAGIGLDASVDNILKIRTRAQTGDAALKASFYASSTIAALTVTSNTIAPTACIHQLGAGLIKTITVPATLASPGFLLILPTAAFTYDATGNILVPTGGGTAVINKLMVFVWDGTKWTPSY